MSHHSQVVINKQMVPLLTDMWYNCTCIKLPLNVWTWTQFASYTQVPNTSSMLQARLLHTLQPFTFQSMYPLSQLNTNICHWVGLPISIHYDTVYMQYWQLLRLYSKKVRILLWDVLPTLPIHCTCSDGVIVT